MGAKLQADLVHCACLETAFFVFGTAPLSVGIMDAEDVPLFVAHSWHIDSKGYVKQTVRRGTKRMAFHREVLGVMPSVLTDHRNRHRSDNRRTNLRAATRRENAANSPSIKAKGGRPCRSSFKGVDWHEGRWRARIYAHAKRKCLGHYPDELAAARAYDAAAREHFGEFAVLNFPM